MLHGTLDESAASDPERTLHDSEIHTDLVRMVTVDSELAASLGFPTPDYVGVERERRWLCSAIPKEIQLRSERITDLYVSGSRLRLREAVPLSGKPAIRRLSRKGDVDAYTRLITSIYLSDEEFALLSGSLPGKRIEKMRHRLPRLPGISLLIDEFLGELSGLVMLEADFRSEELLAAFVAPVYAGIEVTGDPRFTGGALVRQGLPDNLAELLALRG